MKKSIYIIFLLLAVLLTACNTQNSSSEHTTAAATKSEQPANITEVSPETSKKNPINTMEMLANLDSVISVTRQDFSQPIKGAVAYKVLYETENGKLAADVVLPVDYADENKSYPVLLYFPEIGTFIESLASNYALNNIIVIRPYARGYNESEGQRDLGGQKDLADAQALLAIFDSASFIEKSKIFAAGSSEGSVNALRLFAEDTDKRIAGCAVVDVISDLPSFISFRGDGIKNLCAALIGETYDNAPEEYDLRSAVKFSQKLDSPLLLLHYLQNPLMSVEQTDSLYNLVKNANKDCTYVKIDALAGDFQGEGLQRLLSWMKKYE